MLKKIYIQTEQNFLVCLINNIITVYNPAERHVIKVFLVFSHVEYVKNWQN